jgi:hypothetical protein
VSPATLQVVVLYLALVGVLAGTAAAGVRCGTAVRAGVVIGELLLVVQALLAVISYARGHRPGEPATNLGYLVVSVILLPLLAGRALGEAEPTRTEHVVVGLACGVAIVVVLRLHATWS